jgi:hypothetical protein
MPETRDGARKNKREERSKTLKMKEIIHSQLNSQQAITISH